MNNQSISVLVTAYKRKEYLLDALKSLKDQTLDENKFEVIVIKNFEDPKIDSFIDCMNWKNIIPETADLGLKYEIGIKEAKGQIITFLEDDDVYESNRLQYIYSTFQKYNDLIYFHNNQKIINENGNIIDQNMIYPDIYIQDPSRYCDKLFINPGGFHNASSIAIAKEIIERKESLNLLKTIKSSPDLAMLSLAIKQKGSLYLSGQSLTRYRIHMSSSTPHGYVYRKDFKKSLITLAETYNKWAVDARKIIDYTNNIPCIDYIKPYELIRRIEASSTPSWAIKNRPISSFYDFLILYKLGKEHKFIGDKKLLAVLFLDIIVSKLPSELRELYWRIRWVSKNNLALFKRKTNN
ncbi:Glycosyl transferase family 2 [Caldisphaera lagunensis DSM 15908]|uniref:Glycosyl transferase family 2 n=1 Tax=Caldisphaera lagunensis (strain DSM 15908 / JCM 11604 / ANMR 0165 / IC-154) TaxID=1056495 RepID=L0AC02_CALLD|nr:glycosyltransferase family A protein [Caldisphaera lagunensis]AFZ70647.1 Glycosyl transferase family 2 [Caldisphaera lagunensis DSM 15908]